MTSLRHTDEAGSGHRSNASDVTALARIEQTEENGRRSTGVHRFFVLASIALVAAYWSAEATLYLNDVVIAVADFSRFARYVAVAVVVETAIVWLLLRGAGERFADLGLSVAALRDALRTRQVYGAAMLLLMAQPVIAVGHWMVTKTAPGPNQLTGAMTIENLPWWVFFSMFGAPFREELERAFCLTRFERGFGTAGLVTAILVDAVLFGRGHWNQGTIGMITTGISGLGFALVFLRRRRVADAMVAHAVLDSMALFALYTHR